MGPILELLRILISTLAGHYKLKAHGVDIKIVSLSTDIFFTIILKSLTAEYPIWIIASPIDNKFQESRRICGIKINSKDIILWNAVEICRKVKIWKLRLSSYRHALVTTKSKLGYFTITAEINVSITLTNVGDI